MLRTVSLNIQLFIQVFRSCEISLFIICMWAGSGPELLIDVDKFSQGIY